MCVWTGSKFETDCVFWTGSEFEGFFKTSLNGIWFRTEMGERLHRLCVWTGSEFERFWKRRWTEFGFEQNCMNGNYFWTIFKKWTKKVFEWKLFLNYFKRRTEKVCERKLFLNDFQKMNKNRCLNRNYFLNDFKRRTEKVCERKLFLNDFKKVKKKDIWTETFYEQF